MQGPGRFQSFMMVCGLLAGVAAAQQVPQRLTLSKAEAIAMQRYPMIRAAQDTALAAGQEVRERKSAYLPTAEADLTGAGALSDSRIAAGGLNNPIIYSRYANGVSVDQLITDFGRTSNLVKSSRMDAEAQRHEVDTTRNQVLLNVDKAYDSTLRAQALLKVAKQSVQQRQTVVDQVTALERSHLKSAIDLSFAEVNLANAQLLLVQAKNRLNGAYADLAEAMGLSFPREFTLVEQPVPSLPKADLNHLIAMALRQRPELRAMDASSQAARAYAKAEQDLSRPTVSAVAEAGMTPWHASQLPNRYAAVGVNVKIPIFNGFLYSSRKAAADLRSRAVDQRMVELQHRVARDVRLAWLQAQTAYQRMGLTKKLSRQAELALDLAQSRYKLGLGQIVELSQAQLNVTQAELQNTSARYEYEIAIATLNYQLGTHP